MMRGLVQRHRGILPLDTIESIWRVIISTFTYVQAPFSVHADVSVGEPAMRDSARFHFGFTVPFVAHFNAEAAVEAVAKSKGEEAPAKDSSLENVSEVAAVSSQEDQETEDWWGDEKEEAPAAAESTDGVS